MEHIKSEFERFSKFACWTEYELADLCLGRIPSQSAADSDERNEVIEQIHRAAEFGEIERKQNSLESMSLHRYRSRTYYERLSATIWAAKNFPKTFPFKPSNQDIQGAIGHKWPWGNYETELLRKLAAAADALWKNYDPEQKDTAPTNQQVSDWLQKQGVQKRTAEAMATILRADGLPTGRRKS